MSIHRNLSSFPFTPTQKSILIKAGFKTTADCEGIGVVDLAKGISHEDALSIVSVIKESKPSLGTSALELLKKEISRNPIVTLNESLDGMLGGGIPLGKLTEFCGVPGIGKTQLGIQLAVDVSLPTHLLGADGECIYIGTTVFILSYPDTEGSFVIERAVEIAEAVVKHIVDLKEDAQLTVESVLGGIHYFRVHDYVQQVSLVNVLPVLLRDYPRVKLIIIDSVTFHFRHDFDDMGMRSRLLASMAQTLTTLAERHSLAVVLMNQMTTKVAGNSSMLAPALGDTWGHHCTTRVILYWRDGQRYAHLYKSPNKQSLTVPYSVTADGIR